MVDNDLSTWIAIASKMNLTKCVFNINAPIYGVLIAKENQKE